VFVCVYVCVCWGSIDQMSSADVCVLVYACMCVCVCMCMCVQGYK
jgi:hypothetical protein